MKSLNVSNLIPNLTLVIAAIPAMLGMMNDLGTNRAYAQVVVIAEEEDHPSLRQGEEIREIRSFHARDDSRVHPLSLANHIQAIQLPGVSILPGVELEWGTLLLISQEQRHAANEAYRSVTAQWLRPRSAAERMWYQRFNLNDAGDMNPGRIANEERHSVADDNRLFGIGNYAGEYRFQELGASEPMTLNVFPSGQLVFSNSASATPWHRSEDLSLTHREASPGNQEHTVFVRPQVIRRGSVTLRDNQSGMERVFIERLEPSAMMDGSDEDTGSRMLYQVELMQPLGAEQANAAVSEYWIGVECVPLPSMLQRHLHLEDALLVNSVAPNSPASRAGIESQDVLLQYASQSVAETDHLVSLIQQHQDHPVSITLLRHGAQVERTIVAEPRHPVPSAERIYTLGAVVGKEFDPRTIQTAIDRWMVSASDSADASTASVPSLTPQGRLRMVFVRPGVMLKNDELEFGREIQLDERRQLRIRAGAGDELRLELKDRDGIVVFKQNELEKAPARFRGILQDATRRFLWMTGPIEVAGQPLEFYPPGPLTLGWAPQVEATSTWNSAPLQIVVESDVQPVSSEVSTFQLRAINVVKRNFAEYGDIDISVDIGDQEVGGLEEKRILLLRQMESLEREIEALSQEIDALRQQ